MGVNIQKRSFDMLYEGDKITVAVTHEVKVNRDSMWVRYEATSSVQPTEHPDVAKDRVIDHVSHAVIDAVTTAAKNAMD